MHLCVEDWQWWWKAFYALGSVALYVFLYSINYLVFDLKSLSGPVSAILYIGYSLIMAISMGCLPENGRCSSPLVFDPQFTNGDPFLSWYCFCYIFTNSQKGFGKVRGIGQRSSSTDE
ncbi:Transmembrane 9 superfamily member 12 [Camellia lanceoleosa]|uniref:Transmembrane 9 superfamily member 12 n=1 Tax=Camellia lanceoleosa TaxID=1840588 RepID=A0ACC0I0P3_9ERIC|nr:Transmembrane 9 superfamily member 12 [Camellia lanceoleosa]